MKFKHLFVALLTATIAYTTVSCGLVTAPIGPNSPDTAFPEDATIKNIIITNSSSLKTMEIGDIKQIELGITPNVVSPNDSRISISSSDPYIIRVLGNHKIEALNAGTSTITVRGNEAVAKLQITVNNPYVPVTEISILNSDELSNMRRGQTKNIQLSLLPSDVSTDDSRIKITTNNPKILHIEGRSITAIAAGTANIYVTADNARAEVSVNVEETYTALTIKNKDLLQNIWYLNDDNRNLEISTYPVTNIDDLLNNQRLKITSSNPKIVKVSRLKLYPISVGQATITVKLDNLIDIVSLTVSPIPEPTSITLTNPVIAPKLMEQFTLTDCVSFYPNGSSTDITYKITDSYGILDNDRDRFIATKSGTVSISAVAYAGTPKEIVSNPITLTFGSEIDINPLTTLYHVGINELLNVDSNLSEPIKHQNNLYVITGKVTSADPNDPYGHIQLKDKEGSVINLNSVTNSYLDFYIKDNKIYKYENSSKFNTEILDVLFETGNTVKFGVYANTTVGKDGVIKASYEAIFMERIGGALPVNPSSLIINSINATTSLDSIVSSTTWNKGDTVDVTITPNPGFELTSLSMGKGSIEKLHTGEYRITFGRGYNYLNIIASKGCTKMNVLPTLVSPTNTLCDVVVRGEIIAIGGPRTILADETGYVMSYDYNFPKEAKIGDEYTISTALELYNSTVELSKNHNISGSHAIYIKEKDDKITPISFDKITEITPEIANNGSEFGKTQQLVAVTGITKAKPSGNPTIQINVEGTQKYVNVVCYPPLEVVPLTKYRIVGLTYYDIGGELTIIYKSHEVISVEATEIVVPQTITQINTGETIDLNRLCKTSPIGSNGHITYTLSSTDAAKYAALEGSNLRGIEQGNVTVTASFGTLPSKTFSISITTIPPEEIVVPISTVILNVGKKIELNDLCSTNPQGSNANISYSLVSVDATKYATLEGSTLTGVSDGTITIKASCNALPEATFDVCISTLLPNTITSKVLGLGHYSAGTTSIDGVNYDYMELGDYGSGIQMRTKTYKSSIQNTSPFTTGVTKVKLVVSAGKEMYANVDALKIEGGDIAGSYTETLYLSTIVGTRVYILEFTKPQKYVKISHNFNRTLYFESFTFIE